MTTGGQPTGQSRAPRTADSEPGADGPKAPRPTFLSTRARIVAGFFTSIIVVAVGILWGVDTTRNGSAVRQRPARSNSSPTLPSRAILDPNGLIARLPNIRSAAEPQLPANVLSGIFYDTDVSPQRNPADNQSMSWISFNARQAIIARIFVQRSVDPQAAEAELSRRLKSGANVHIHQTSGPERGSGIDTGNATRIKSLGDEAFSHSQQEEGISQPETDNGGRKYDIAGGAIGARYRNVVIEVTYEGANYPPSAVRKSPMRGTPLSYTASRQTAKAVISAIIAQLS